MSDDALKAAGIGPGTLRLSVGIEHIDDLKSDLSSPCILFMMKEHTYIYNEPFQLESGSVLSGIRIHYHCSQGSWAGRKVVWICHALTANSNPLEWWPTMVGPGKFLDPGREYIICANVLGSCYGSTQPRSKDFPLITIRDMVKAHELLRLHLGI